MWLHNLNNNLFQSVQSKKSFIGGQKRKADRIAHRIPFKIFCDVEQGPTVLVLRNSFFSEVQPFFSAHFKESHFIWDMSYHDDNYNYVRKYSPDIVVEQRYESYNLDKPPVTTLQ